MATQRYSVTPQSIQTLLTWVKTGEIAIPEIQRPFVWKATQVRDLLDSLYHGYPVGYLIAWKNPTVKLKDGSPSAGKRILIDGQQRVTALMASMLGQEVLTKDYETVPIRIAFHPLEERFEVTNPAIRKDSEWIPDVERVFAEGASLIKLTRSFGEANPEVDEDEIAGKLEKLRNVVYNSVGIINLAESLDIETVAEIFIRVNSAGAPLSQADFAMSKIAVNETHGGNELRKAIDYFCHLAVAPEFYPTLKKNDSAFASTGYFAKMSWLKNENDEIYDPTYTDMLRVAFTTRFRRGRLQDLVALLSGRNFETKHFEEEIVENSFARLREGVMDFMNETHFKRLVMIIRSGGFVHPALIGSQNSLNFAYILYLTLREQGVANEDIERHVRRWFVMSVLSGRYSGSPETRFDQDIRRIHGQGIESYADTVYQTELSDAFWDVGLPQAMETSVASSPYFRVFRAAQVKLNDKGFLSKDITVRELIEVKSDVHHVFPRAFLKKHGMTRGRYNQIANYVVTQSEINIAIGSKEPKVYFGDLSTQCDGGEKRYGNITDPDELRENLRMNCIPDGMSKMTVDDYPAFLEKRRNLMSKRMREYFERL